VACVSVPQLHAV
jgi:hypothetical protein